MSTATTHTGAIDAALAKGAWWMRLFSDLANRGVRQAEALDVETRKNFRQGVDDLDHIARAVRLAIAAAIRLKDFLTGLAQLSKLSPGDLAAARARAKAKADAEAAARETARDKARARRQARAAKVREGMVEIIEREKPVRRDRDPLVEALDRRLAVDPALVDLDDLPLRETVMRICADLGITPDWSLWKSGDWTEPTPARLMLKPKPRPPPQILAQSVLLSLSDLFARRPDTAISLVLQAGPFAPPWLPPRPG